MVEDVAALAGEEGNWEERRREVDRRRNWRRWLSVGDGLWLIGSFGALSFGRGC